MSEDDELSKIYKDLNEEDLAKAKLIVPRLMETLYKMDDEARSRGGDNTFTLKQVHKESQLGSISEETFTMITKLGRRVDEPLIDFESDERVSLTDKGRTWCSVHKGG